jgi:hypothetical protein
MNVSSSEYALKDRTSFKLILLFLLTFFVLLIGFVLYSIFTTMFAKSVAGMAVPEQPKVIAIDPKLESELSKVLEYNTEDNGAESKQEAVVNDPFNDRSNISNIVANQPNIMTTSPGNQGTTSPNATGTAKKEAGSTNPQPSKDSLSGSKIVNSGGSKSGNNNETVVVKEVSTADRLSVWRQSANYGFSADPEPDLFAVEDLIPVGVVSGGDEKKEVIFYSQAADRTLSFPIGTRFFDAWLTEANDDGVIFRFNDVYNSTRLKSWGRSIKTRSGRKLG